MILYKTIIWGDLMELYRVLPDAYSISGKNDCKDNNKTIRHRLLGIIKMSDCLTKRRFFLIKKDLWLIPHTEPPQRYIYVYLYARFFQKIFTYNVLLERDIGFCNIEFK